MELLPHGHRDSVLHLRAPHFEHVLELVTFGPQGLDQALHRVGKIGEAQEDREAHRRWVDVVGGLPEVHVVVRVEVFVLAAFVPEDFEAAVRDDLVGVHVGAGARAALDEVDDEVLVMLSVFDLGASLGDRIGLGLFEAAESLVGAGRRVLDIRECRDERGEVVQAEIGNAKVLKRPEGLDPVEGVGWYLAVSEEVMLDAHGGHIVVHVLVVGS